MTIPRILTGIKLVRTASAFCAHTLAVTVACAGLGSAAPAAQYLDTWPSCRVRPLAPVPRLAAMPVSVFRPQHATACECKLAPAGAPWGRVSATQIPRARPRLRTWGIGATWRACLPLRTPPTSASGASRRRTYSRRPSQPRRSRRRATALGTGTSLAMTRHWPSPPTTASRRCSTSPTARGG